MQFEIVWSHDRAVYLWCVPQLETRRWNPASVKLILQDTQDQSNVWSSMPNHCVRTCWLFLEIEGDTQCDHLPLATEKTSFLLTGGFAEGGEAACFGFASSRGRSSLDPGCGNLDHLTTELGWGALNICAVTQSGSADIRPLVKWDIKYVSCFSFCL